VHAEEAELPQLAGHVQRELRVLEPLGDAREDPVRHPSPDRVPDVALLVGKERVQAKEIEGVDAICRAAHRHHSIGEIRLVSPRPTGLRCM
jgi:hypothetical protein